MISNLPADLSKTSGHHSRFACRFYFVILVFLIGTTLESNARQFYVASTGSPSGNGSANNPWDLQTALDHPAQLSAGDTLWVGEGVYSAPLEGFVSVLTGSPAAPIIVRNQDGGRATIDGGFHVRGEDTWYWGLEFATSTSPPSSTLSSTEQKTLIESGSFRRSNIQADRATRGIRFINNVIHSNYESLIFQPSGDDNWMYGNILSDNGRIASDGVAGDAVLAQFDGANGSLMISENIIANNLANGMLMFGGGMQVDGNIFVSNGRDALNRKADATQILGLDLGAVTFQNNFFYVNPRTVQEETTHGSLSESTREANIQFENNLLENGGFQFRSLNALTFAGNTIGPRSVLETHWPENPVTNPDYSFSDNQYFLTRFVYSYPSESGIQNVTTDTSSIGFQMWQDSLLTGIASVSEVSSDFSDTTPTETIVIVRPNDYESGRANIIVLNRADAPAVEISVANVLQLGANYSLRRITDFFGSPVVSGTYDGNPLVISSDLLGDLTNTGSEIGVFVLSTDSSGGDIITTPTANRSLSDIVVSNGGSSSIELEGTSPLFSDQDPLLYSSSSSDSGIATAVISGSQLVVQAISSGTVHVSVSANDGRGGVASVGFTVSVIGATEHHVTTTGSPSGDGSVSNPWDLQTALDQPLSVSPGDIISIHGGIYPGSFWGRLVGTESAPIVVRSAPGEWATIDIPAQPSFDAFVFGGQFTHYRDFEIMSSDTENVRFGTATSTRGDFNKLVNLVIHDVATNTFGGRNEMYGSIVYNIGDNSGDGQGHDLYMQNNFLNQPSQVNESVIFNPYGFGIHIFAGGTGGMSGIHLTGNAVFGSGVPHERELGFDNIVVGGGLVSPPDNILLRENMGWTQDPLRRSVSLGRFSSGNNKAVSLVNNYLKGETNFSTTWESISMEGNTFIGPVNGEVDVSQHTDNTYLDQITSGSKVFLRPNAYEPGRAHLIVYNWDHAASLNVDLTGLFEVGTAFEVRNVQNVFGEPIFEGLYDGNMVSIPLEGFEPVQPIGPGLISPDEFTTPEFNVFLVRRADSGTFVNNEAQHLSDEIPNRLGLGAVYPNPVTTSLNVQFELSRAAEVRLEILDLLGRRILEVDLGYQVAGQHLKQIGLNNLPSGVLFLRIDSSGDSVAKPFIKLR